MNREKGTLLRKVWRAGASAALGLVLFGGVAVAPAAAQWGYRNDSYYQRGYNNTFFVRQAQQFGYRDGYQRGVYDRRIGIRRPNPPGHGAFQNGLDGWNPSWGGASIYRANFRQAFLRGYWDGYQRGR